MDRNADCYMCMDIVTQRRCTILYKGAPVSSNITTLRAQASLGRRGDVMYYSSNPSDRPLQASRRFVSFRDA